MGCNESENVNFSDRSYEAKMTRYISYEMRGKSEKVIEASKSSIRIWSDFVTKSHTDKCKRNNEKHLVKINT